MGPRSIPVGARLALLVLALSAGATTVQAQEADTVKVIEITVDSLHPDQVGPNTPTLQMLKDAGVWWTQHRAVMASETLPNHVAMATGAYPVTNGLPGNDGRAEVGDAEPADPDLGVPSLRTADSFTVAMERVCPDLRTVTVFSKEYVWRTFQDEADSDFNQPMFNIPQSGHAPDTSTMGFLGQDVGANGLADYTFVNLGDVDRSGHIDTTGFTGTPLTQTAALEQTDALLGAFVQQLQQMGEWEHTVLVVNSDHSMDWTPQFSGNVDIEGALEGDPATAGSFWVSNNGGAAFVYLLDPARADADTVLQAARTVITGLDGVDEALYREPNALDPGNDLRSVHPTWRNWTPRAGEIFVTVLPGSKAGSIDGNPLPGNHGMVATRHATMMVTGGWDGIDGGKVIDVPDPALIDVYDDTAIFEGQSEQVDIAPTFGWLTGVPDPGVSAGGPAQWEGRVLQEAFTRQPDPSCVAAVAEPAPTPTPTPTPTPPAEPALPATGGGLAVLGLVLAGLVTQRRR